MVTQNWSGYALAGNAFTGVTGTFDVPKPLDSASCLEETSVWVGVDGLYNHDLLQAGIAETGFALRSGRRSEWPAPTIGPIVCGSLVQVYAWWEDFPSRPVRVNIPIEIGDRVSVSIFKMSPGWWALAVHDLTTTRSFPLGPTLWRAGNLSRVGGGGTGDNGGTDQPSALRRRGLPQPRYRR